MSFISIPPTLDLKSPAIWLATWFGSGFMKPGPGTWGSLMALPFAIFIHCAFGFTPFVVITFATYFVGLWAAYEYEKASGEHDAKQIVIDEVVGQWIALFPVFAISGLSWTGLFIAFCLFRFFDILKPWPISYCDKHIQGASGVMFDDILAGLFAGLFFIGIAYAGFS